MSTNVFNSYLRNIFGDASSLDLTIDPRDEMLLFTIESESGDADRALVRYVEQGAVNAQLMLDLIAWRFGGSNGVKLLDFASGYGRVTRHLIRTFPREMITVSDIVAEAVAFQQKQFGVRGMVSTTDAAEFVCEEKFDLIFVASLFSHLPERTFRSWLAKLIGLLSPRGVLAFSVHDQSIVASQGGDVAAPFIFLPASESKVLESAEYGSTWVSEAWVRTLLSQIAPDAAHIRLPKGLANYQDLYLVVKGDAAPLDRVPDDPGPFGFIDRAWFEEDELRSYGWAVENSARAKVSKVELWLGDSLAASCSELYNRADVAAHLGSSRALLSGWDLRATLPSGFSFSDPVFVVARSSGDRRTLLYSGSLDGLLLHTAKNDLKTEKLRSGVPAEPRTDDRTALKLKIGELERTIEEMRSSRAWRAADRWWRIKRAFGRN